VLKNKKSATMKKTKKELKNTIKITTQKEIKFKYIIFFDALFKSLYIYTLNVKTILHKKN
jgi:hypothetical protein